MSSLQRYSTAFSSLEYHHLISVPLKSPHSPVLHKVAKARVSLNKSGLSMCVYHWAPQCVTKAGGDTHCTSTFTATGW